MPTAPASSTAAVAIGKPLPPDLKDALGDVTEISSLPEVTTKIVQVVEDPRATAHDMHEIVRTDPALAAKILKVVNSAFYGLPSQIASLDRAIMMLGLSAVKNIALAASLSRMFSADDVCEQFAARDLWRHSVAVGVCGRLLTAPLSKELADEAFVCGLVHDMGLIVVQQLFPNKLKKVIEQCHNTAQSFCEAEESVIGADHQAFGAALAAKWKFPLPLRYAIAYHHTPEEVPAEFQRLAAAINVADAICCRSRYGLWLTAQDSRMSAEQLKLINLTPPDLEPIIEELGERVEEAERVFAEK